MSHDLTVADEKQLRRLLRKGGWPNLIEELGIEPNNKPGRGPIDDERKLARIEIFLRVALKDRGMKRFQALHWIISYTRERLPEAFPGSTDDAVVRRFYRKLKEGGYDTKDMKKLIPREWVRAGIDPTKFTLEPPPKKSDSDSAIYSKV
jgi:hypothetical protein